MARRRKFADRHNAGRSAVVPFKPGEAYTERHARRLMTNYEMRDIAYQWADVAGVVLTISNECHHWKFVCNGANVQWWPSSAKCIANERWANGTHAHDIFQVLRICIWHFELEPDQL